MADLGIATIDLVVVNLYPFAATVARGAPRDECIENIDIGGPALIRAAAKNHAHVAVIVDPGDYRPFMEDLSSNQGAVSDGMRERLAAKAFAHVAAYDGAIAAWFAEREGELPEHLAVSGTGRQPLRYGENPHQRAALYATGHGQPGVVSARQVQGKELSYNNIADADAALALVADLNQGRPAAVIVKHANPCGAAHAASLAEAYRLALRCDPVSAFGGIVAANVPVDVEAASEIASIFTAVVIAPDADEGARRVFAEKKNLRVLLTGAMPDPARDGVEFRSIGGGILAQTRDGRQLGADGLTVVSKRAPTDTEHQDLLFAQAIAKHVKSNAIVFVREGATTGIGAGQMSRLDSVHIAARKAAEAATAAKLPQSLARGSVAASDAFFPFADGLVAVAEAGATAVIQPGGSVRDEEVIAAADDAGLAMVFSGVRHFRH